MNYPAIKAGDKVSFYYTELPTLSMGIDFYCTVEISEEGIIHFKNSVIDIPAGYQDNPQLMENGIRIFRIHERADGTPVFMEGDVLDIIIYDTGAEVGSFVMKERNGNAKVMYVAGDMFGYVVESFDGIQWMTFNKANSNGWKLKDQEDTVEEETTCSCSDIDNPLLICNECAKSMQHYKSEKTYTKQEIVDVINEELKHTYVEDCAVGAVRKVAEKLGITYMTKQTYTKEEIVNVLRKLQVHMNYRTLAAVAKELGINSEELE